MRRLAAVVAAASILGACSTTSSPGVTAGQAIAGGWASLDAAALAADTAVKAGRLKGAQAATVSADLKKAAAALNIATTAYKASASADVTVQVTAAATAVAEITLLVGGQ